ncbi:autotransporter outer membrane beta-barrel domain-containing protein [Pseudomonas migulae]|uniref:Autotransporter domain-containing protein n=1 Tax=Pseudomonas migulae TaxID=78543 RepID=A0ABY8MT53_9PSED|nr:autotransporter outer membrane beta-barrel domain-containing protein [Pseudomonas migulae]WGK90540.1 autotransporter domain-containing protein [Pseudomonas migulae]
MPKPYPHRPHRIALAVALTLGSIELSTAQQAELDTVIEAPAKKARATPWPRRDDLLAIKNFIGPMSHAVNAAAPEPIESSIPVISAPPAPEPVDLYADLYEFPETPDDSRLPNLPEKVAERIAAEPVINDLLATGNLIPAMEQHDQVQETPDTPSEPVNGDAPLTFEDFANADTTKRTTASGRYTSIDGVSLALGDANDLLIINKGASFSGEIQGGDGVNGILLDSPESGVLGQTRNFLGLRVARGAWSLTGKGDFDVGAEVLSGAKLFNMGSIAGDVDVLEGGTYGGHGEVRDLFVRGTLMVTEALGAPHVKGDLILTQDATLSYAVTAAGQIPTIVVDGVADLWNASLNVAALPGSYSTSNVYTLLRASKVGGEFDRVTSNLAYLTPKLFQSETEVMLQYARNEVPLDDFALDDNSENFALSVVEPAASANAAITALLGSTVDTAANALDQLSGYSTANLAKTTLNSDAPVSASMLSAMRQLDDAYSKPGRRSSSPRLAAGSENEGRVWLQALGHGGKVDRDFDALQHSTKGLVMGADWRVDEEWRLGVIGGKSDTRLDSRTLDGRLDSWHLGAYALRQNGPMSLRLGLSHSSHDGSTKRRVAFNGFSDNPKGQYDANTQHAFAEVGYNVGRDVYTIEPFANLGYQRYQRDDYKEKGGDATLKVLGQTRNNVNSTFGLRVAKLNTLNNGIKLTPHLSAGWKHTYGEVLSHTRQKLATGGTRFTVEGAPLDRNSVMLDAGIDLSLSARHTLGVGVTGEIGTDSRNHGVTGQWRMTF